LYRRLRSIERAPPPAPFFAVPRDANATRYALRYMAKSTRSLPIMRVDANVPWDTGLLFGTKK